MPIAPLTRSDLSTIARCPRKFWYKKVVGLPDSASSKAMSEGTIIHRGLEVAYLTARGLDGISDESDMRRNRSNQYALTCMEAGARAMAEMTDAGTYEYHGETQELSPDTREQESRDRCVDAFAYFMGHSFLPSLDGWSVFATEKEFAYTIGGVTIEGTIDLVLRHDETGRFAVWDHKTVGQAVNVAVRFLALDVQMNTYENMVCDALKVDAVEMVYNLIRRDRPPGFGSRSLLTKAGKKSTASTNPEDYLRQVRWSHSERERGFTQNVLEDYLKDATNLLQRTYGPNRVPIKSGGEACMTSCAYNSRCAAEMLGYAEPTFTPAVLEPEDD